MNAPSRPSSPTRRAAASWLLTQLADLPARRRSRATVIVGSIIAVIGLLDYLSGTRLSLELFYLVPIALGIAWLGARAGVVIAATSIVVRVGGDLAIGPYSYPDVALWNRLTDFAVYLVFVWAIHGLISLYREVDRRVDERTRALQESMQVRQRLERELLDIAARERNAIGRELHDDLCQQLVGTAFAAKVLAEHLAARDPAAARDAQAIVKYVEEGIAKTRGLARGLLLSSVEPENLAHELADLAAQGTAGGVQCSFKLEGRPVVSDAATGAQLLRIAQEALRNALRHAKPQRVDVVLGGSDEATFLLIKDDGSGLTPPAARSAGMGLRIMEHRAALIGGVLSVIPAPGEGTRVICHVPRASAPSPA